MKARFALFLAVLLLVLAGCGGQVPSETVPETVATLQTTVPETTAPETTVPETTAAPGIRGTPIFLSCPRLLPGQQCG